MQSCITCSEPELSEQGRRVPHQIFGSQCDPPIACQEQEGARQTANIIFSTPPWGASLWVCIPGFANWCEFCAKQALRWTAIFVRVCWLLLLKLASRAAATCAVTTHDSKDGTGPDCAMGHVTILRERCSPSNNPLTHQLSLCQEHVAARDAFSTPVCARSWPCLL